MNETVKREKRRLSIGIFVSCASDVFGKIDEREKYIVKVTWSCREIIIEIGDCVKGE